MKLYYSENLNPRVAVAVARYLKSPVEYIKASPRDPKNEDAFRVINPNCLVPVLVEDTRTTWETDAVACRLSAIAGVDFWRTGDSQPEMIQWVSWSAHHLTRAGGALYFEHLIRPRYMRQPPNTAIVDEALPEFERYAAVLDRHLEGRRWLVDERISYADFRAASALPFAEGAKLPLAQFKQVQRWHAALCELDAWRTPFAGLPG